MVFSKTDSTKVSGEWPLSAGASKEGVASSLMIQGFYRIQVVTQDRDGNEITDVKFLEVFDTHSGKLSAPSYLWTYHPDRTYEPGESATVQLGTSTGIYLVKKRDDTKINKEKYNYET